MVRRGEGTFGGIGEVAESKIPPNIVRGSVSHFQATVAPMRFFYPVIQ